MASKIIFYEIVMMAVIFSIMTSTLIESGFGEGRPQTLVFKIGRFVISNSNTTAITYELNLTGIHNPTSAKILLGGVSENGEVVADLIQPDSSKTKDKKFGTLLTGSITDTSLQGSMKGKSLSDLITAMRDGSTYVSIDTSTNPKGEIRGQMKIHGSASNQIADTNLIVEECSNNGTPCDGGGQGTKETIQESPNATKVPNTDLLTGESLVETEDTTDDESNNDTGVPRKQANIKFGDITIDLKNDTKPSKDLGDLQDEEEDESPTINPNLP